MRFVKSDSVNRPTKLKLLNEISKSSTKALKNQSMKQQFKELDKLASSDLDSASESSARDHHITSSTHVSSMEN